METESRFPRVVSATCHCLALSVSPAARRSMKTTLRPPFSRVSRARRRTGSGAERSWLSAVRPWH